MLTLQTPERPAAPWNGIRILNTLNDGTLSGAPVKIVFTDATLWGK